MLAGRARPRVVRELVRREEEHRGVGLEERLGAVSVVDVPVDDQDPVQLLALAKRARGDRYVVEEAESHAPIRLSVVAGRPNGGEAGVEVAARHGAGEVDGCSCGEAGYGEALGADVGIGIELCRRLPHGRADVREMFAPMGEEQLIVLGGAR